MSNKSLLPQITVNSTQVLTQLSSGQLLTIDPRRRGGLIVCKRHHAEFAGPGSAVGGVCDIDSSKVIPVGDLGLTHPESYQERQKAYAMRQKWFRFTQKAMESSVPLQRAQTILFLLVDTPMPKGDGILGSLSPLKLDTWVSNPEVVLSSSVLPHFRSLFGYALPYSSKTQKIWLFWYLVLKFFTSKSIPLENPLNLVFKVRCLSATGFLKWLITRFST